MFKAGWILIGVGLLLLLAQAGPRILFLPLFFFWPLLLGALIFGFLGRRGPWRGWGHGWGHGVPGPYRGRHGHHGWHGHHGPKGWGHHGHHGPKSWGHGGCGPRDPEPRPEERAEPQGYTGETTRL